jgi:hypothetical protein
MIDTKNKECRYIMTPKGIGKIDVFIIRADGQDERVAVWVGKYDIKTPNGRVHAIFDAEDCEELNG